MNERLETAAMRFEAMASELEKALKHCQVAASHFRSQEVPRGCAHATAIQGHLLAAQELLNEFAKTHRESAKAL